MVRRPDMEKYVFRMGLVGSLLYLCYFGYCLYFSVFAADQEAQIAVAFVSFPTSAVFLSFSHSLFEWLGPYGSPPRRAGEWVCLGLAGLIQYFVIGVVFAMMIRGIRSDGGSKIHE